METPWPSLFAAGVKLVGVHDVPVGPYRPLVLTLNDAEAVWLTSPLDPLTVLREVELPQPLEEPFVHVVEAHNPDLNGDGVPELALAFDPVASGSQAAVTILDGQGLEPIVSQIVSVGDAWKVWFGFIDLDGDGTDELVTTQTSGSMVTRSWYFDSASRALQLSGELIIARDSCFTSGFKRGDFNGDGLADLALFWDDDCRDHPLFSAMQAPTFLGGSMARDGALEPVYSTQPVFPGQVTVADFDHDGRDEVLLAVSPSDLYLLRWQDGQFVTDEHIITTEVEATSFGTFLAGTFGPDQLVGVVAGSLTPNEGGPTARERWGALFPSLNHDYIYIHPDPVLVSDFNSDGRDDFVSSDSEGMAVYLSNQAGP